MFSVGLVGLPNAGKSTLFNLLTKRSVPAENFPFCTIDPHAGIVEVPDSRIDRLATICNSSKKVFAAIEFHDIAGLVKNAHQGAGLGNQFLSHIRETDLILMVVRCFQNDDIIHVENRVDPSSDEEILMLELCMADQNMLEKMLPRLEKEMRGKDKLADQKIELLERILTCLSSLKPANQLKIDPKEFDPEVIKWRKTLNLLTDKSILRLANITEGGSNLSYNSDFQLDIGMESSISDMTSEERLELGVGAETGLDQMIRACYSKLNLATYLTGGPMEARAWTFTSGSTAPECAGKIHTDFQKKFIKAEVASFQDFSDNNGWKAAWEKGLVRSLGKDYLMQDGDVVEFKIGG